MDQFRPRDDQYSVRDLQKGVDDAKRVMNRYLGGAGPWLVIVIILIIYLLTGFYRVGPGEKAVVLLFGKKYSEKGPGLRYRLPRPFMSHFIVDIAEVRRAEIGFRSGRSRPRTVDAESLMLTGDENIVDVHLLVQYRVQDPVKFLFGCDNPLQALRVSAEVALRGIVGENTIDHTMTKGRLDVQQKVRKYLQKLLDDYHTGLLVSETRLQAVDAPSQVREAFHDVVRAWEDRQRLIRVAEGYREDILPKARGEAAQELRKAEAYKAQRVIRAKGDAQRFATVLQEYRKAPKVTRERLYLESVEKYLPTTKKFVMEGGKSSVLPLLPLTGAFTDGQKSVPEQQK
jgi:membrane protease subunit HflK